MQLLTEPAETADLYESLDVHVQAGLDVDALSGQIQLARLEEDLRTSENTRRFTQLLAVAISGSETVRTMNATVDAPVWLSPLEYERTVSAMLSGLNISTSLEITTNDSFADVADNKWLKLTVAFHYNTKINQLDLDAEFSFVEYFTLNTGSTAKKGVMKLDTFDVHIDAYSQTEMAFMILVKTASNDGFVDITKEVSKLIEGLTEDNAAVPTFLEEVLGNRGDYITVAEVDLYSYTYRVQNPVPVLEINFDIKFVVKLNMALGLDAKTTLMSARRIGVQGSETEGTIRKYDYALNGDNRQSFELVCAGYLGLKAGILLDLNVCFTGLEKLGKVGVSGEVGVYMDLWGYLKLDLYKDNLTSNPTISMNGGMLMELGLYVELKLYAVSEVFGAKAELVLLDRKFPMYTLGNQYVVYRFDQGGKTVIMNTNEMDLKHLLGIQILDLKTGKITGGEYTQLKDFSLEVSNPWFYYHEAYGQRLAVGPEFFGTTKNGVYVPKGTQKLETTLRVHYDGGSLSFSLGNFNEVKVIWVDPSVDPNTVALGAIRKATYQVVLDGVTTKVDTKLVPAGEVPGAVDLSPWLQYTEIQSRQNDCHAAIWTDTTYTYVLEPLQIFASYIYWSDGTWRYERYALEMGDVLPEPAGAQSSPGMVFKGWNPDVYWTRFDSDDLGTMVITPELMGFYKDIGLTHKGHDTTVPVEIFTGGQTPCVTRYLQNNADPDTKAVFHSTAMYDPVRVNITYMYPAATHYVYGEAVTVFASQETREVWYGNKPAASMPAYPYWRPTGWDADGDNDVDYAYDNLPIATQDATYRLMLMRQDVSHTVTYRTAHGRFSDGSQVMTFTGDYPACQAYMDDFSETLGPVVENGIRYTFTGWRQFAGSASFEFDAQWQAEVLMYTATFDAGEGVFTVAGEPLQTIAVRYGAEDAVDFNAFIQPEKAADVVHTYSLTGWRDGEGTVYGLADQPVLTADTTFTAVYGQTDIVYTVEVNVGNGTFGDGTTVKRYHGKYGDPLSISVDAPVPPDGVANYYVYEFDGWSAAFPTSFTQDVIIAATYRQVDIPYTIVFDAGGGYFDGDPAKTQISGTYTYGQAVAIPTPPARANDETGGSTFGYAFIGWSPTVQAVSGDQTYIATYSRYLVGGEVGITVSDGSITEDISVGSLGEYSYFVHDTLGVPTLRVTTGSVITISGSSDDLRLEIDSGVEAVRFKDLAISVDGSSAPVYGKSETLFIEPYSGSDPAAGTLQVVVEGTCVVDNARMDGVPVYLERPVRFGGAGEDPSLTITGSAYTLIYRTDDLTFQDLSLALNAQYGSSGGDASWVFGDIGELGDAKLFRLDGVQGDFDSTADGFMGANLQIVDSTIAMDCAGSLGTVSALTIQNSTLTATGGTGFSVTDTTATQSVQFTDPADITIAVASGPAINPVTKLQVKTPSALEVDGGMLRYQVP